MAHNLHKLSYNFWLWNSLGLNGVELQGIFQWYNIPYIMDKTSRESGWKKKRTNTELIRIFSKLYPKTIKIDPDLLKNLFLTKYLHKGNKLYLTWNSSK